MPNEAGDTSSVDHSSFPIQGHGMVICLQFKPTYDFALRQMSRIESPGSKATATMNCGGEVDGDVPKIIRDKIDDGGTPPRTSQATSQATPSTPAPPNSNSAKGRKPFGPKVCYWQEAVGGDKHRNSSTRSQNS
ncbi:hypothetical protein C8R44DRAFT_745362 [Mycena epipterygia]|nr:hypothetical protein C8R44DRAFT_745362 [Mycena epipterygia]